MNKYKFNEIKVGLEEHIIISVDADKVDKFIEISGDTNPLHTNAKYSKSKGFLDKIVHGMLTSTFYSTLVGIYLPGKYCILQGIDVQFLKPVFIGDKLKVIGKVTYINAAYKQLEIKAIILNQKNTKVSKAIIKVGVMDD